MNSLTVSGLSVWYHKAQVITDVNLQVPENAFVSIVGANGSGKTTLLRSIVNLHTQKSGIIELQGENVTRTPTHRIVRRGLTYVPDYRGILRSLTIKENLSISNFMLKDRAAFNEELDSILQLFPNLKYRYTMAAGLLSGGEQQMLAIARALMYRPRILLIDEPSIGLAPLLVGEIFQKLRTLIDKGMSILMVEQNVTRSLRASDYCYVLEKGRIIIEGRSRELVQHSELNKLYFGIRPEA
jgi:branched-chain amino acid transport system ATP-binding protein